MHCKQASRSQIPLRNWFWLPLMETTVEHFWPSLSLRHAYGHTLLNAFTFTEIFHFIIFIWPNDQGLLLWIWQFRSRPWDRQYSTMCCHRILLKRSPNMSLKIAKVCMCHPSHSYPLHMAICRCQTLAPNILVFWCPRLGTISRPNSFWVCLCFSMFLCSCDMLANILNMFIHIPQSLNG